MADIVQHRFLSILENGDRWVANCACGWTSGCAYYNDCIDQFQTHLAEALHAA